MSARGVALVGVVLLLSCGHEPITEVIVIVDTDLSVPSELDSIRITVTHDDGASGEALADLAASAPRPAILGLVSRAGEGVLDVVAVGEHGGREIVRRTARVAFVRGHVVALRMDLWMRCVSRACEAAETCGDSGCRSIEILPEELTEWSSTGDTALESDAGPDSSSMDASSDAGPVDARPSDAWARADDGPPDAVGSECRSSPECDDGWTCTQDRCTGGRCVFEARDSACDDGLACTVDRCDLVEGCVYVTDDTACSDGIDCTLDDCDRLAGCRSVPRHDSCASGLYCDGATGCAIAPSFTEVYTSIVQVRCTPCHITATPRSGGLDMSTEAAAYASLIGVTATCGGGINTRVLPRDSVHSLLWRKVAGVDLCGARMPRLLTPLDDAQITLIERWINGGALE